MNILFVCLGNICRSPLAEGIMRHHIQKNNLDWQVDSAGTGNWHIGSQPHKDSIRVAKQNGIDISNQKARQFKLQDFEEFDIIFALDNNNFKDLLHLASSDEHKSKVKLASQMIDNYEIQDIPDPYYGTYKDYEFVFHHLNTLSKAYIASTN